MGHEKSINDYIYYYELTYGGYIENKEDKSYEEELNNIYNSNKDKQKIFDILKNNKELRYLYYAFPHEATIKNSCLKDNEYILELDMSNSFSKPLYNGTRQEQVKLCFKLLSNIDSTENIVSKLTQRYDVEMIDLNHYKFSFECSNDLFNEKEIIEFEFSDIKLLF